MSDPEPRPEPEEPSPASEKADGGVVEDEDAAHEVDPHPDTPDDYDEDAVGPRESVEAVPDA